MFGSNAKGLRFYPKLKVFKNSTNSNVFDGTVARSYRWYVYAIVRPNGEIVMTENSYGPTTSRHMSEFTSLVDRSKIKRVRASRGLDNLNEVTAEIKASIANLESDLLNKRNRNIESRKDRIAELQQQLLTVAALIEDQRIARALTQSQFLSEVA